MEIKRSYVEEFTGACWVQVCQAVSHVNVSSSLEKDVNAALTDLKVRRYDRVLLVAQQSIGGRQVTLGDHAYPADILTDWWGGWTVVLEGDANWLFAKSATSGTSVEASHSYGEGWTITLTSPFEEDGRPYRGAYFAAFKTAADMLGSDSEIWDLLAKSYDNENDDEEGKDSWSDMDWPYAAFPDGHPALEGRAFLASAGGYTAVVWPWW